MNGASHIPRKEKPELERLKEEQDLPELSSQMVTIITTEHYNLQTGRSMTVADANGRSTLFHGQRFLVLSRDGIGNENLAWKDTVLVRAGETVDILVDMSNPGAWMVHCHITEHLESGMMFTYYVHEKRV